MPSIIELFKNKELLFPGGSSAEGSVKKDTETFIEQETSGIRIKSLVDVNNPLIYGNEATRLVNKSTPSLETMKEGTSGTEGGGGLIGKGLDKLTGGKVKSLGDVRDKVNSKLGIPTNLIPSAVINKLKDPEEAGYKKDHNSTEPITPDYLGANGSELGKFLKSTGGGNPTTIGKQALGKGIGVAKDKLRGALFGEQAGLGQAFGKDDFGVEFTSNKKDSNYTAVNTSKTITSTNTVAKDLENTKLDLRRVSPIYGVKRKKPRIDRGGTNVVNNSIYSPSDPATTTFTKEIEPKISSEYGLSRLGDKINKVSPTDIYTLDDQDAFLQVQGKDPIKDFIPLWFRRVGSEKPVVFRAIISGLTETSTPSWSGNKFVGNPYQFYMYDGVERGVAFNVKIFAASPLEMSGVWERLKILTSYTYPIINGGLTSPPIIDFRLGDIYSNRKAFVDSLTYTIPDESNWETNGDIGYLPKMVDVAISLKLIETPGDEERLYDMAISQQAVDDINDKRTKDQETIDQNVKTGPTDDLPKAPKESTRKKASVSINGSKLQGKAKSASERLSEQKKKLNIFGKEKKTTNPSDSEEGVSNTSTQQSSTADALDGKTPSTAVSEKASEANIQDAQADTFVSLGIIKKDFKEVKKSAISSDYRLLNDENSDLPNTIFFTWDNGAWGQQYGMIYPDGTVTNFYYDPAEEPFNSNDDVIDSMRKPKG